MTAIPGLHGIEESAMLFRRSGPILGPYHEYVTRVSSPDMAISVELASFLLALCWRTHPARVLDTGSGFSSFVLRTYQVDHPDVDVWSVDDDADWLRKTGDFLRAHGLPSMGLVTWEQFQVVEHGGFNVILHDMGDMVTRRETLPRVLACAMPGGCVVLDDMHVDGYAQSVHEVVEGTAYRVTSLRSLTLDRYGRYSSLVDVP